MEGIIADLVKLKAEFYKWDLWGVEKPTMPNPGASINELEAVENLINSTSNHDYFNFLKLANGWVNFSVQTHIFSTYQLDSEFSHFAIKQIAKHFPDLRASFIPIGASDPEFQEFWAFLIVCSETETTKIVECNSFGDWNEYSSFTEMLETFIDGFKLTLVRKALENSNSP
jgi:hypothetical protein